MLTYKVAFWFVCVLAALFWLRSQRRPVESWMREQCEALERVRFRAWLYRSVMREPVRSMDKDKVESE